MKARCPFCGNDALYAHIDSNEAWVWCWCGASGPTVGIESTQELTIQRAANAWNKHERENAKLRKQLAKARLRIQAVRKDSRDRSHRVRKLCNELFQSSLISEGAFYDFHLALNPPGESFCEDKSAYSYQIAKLGTIQREILDEKAGAK